MLVPSLNALMHKNLEEAGSIRQLTLCTGIDPRSLQKMINTGEVATVDTLVKLLTWLKEPEVVEFLASFATIHLQDTPTQLISSEAPKESPTTDDLPIVKPSIPAGQLRTDVESVRTQHATTLPNTPLTPEEYAKELAALKQVKHTLSPNVYQTMLLKLLKKPLPLIPASTETECNTYKDEEGINRIVDFDPEDPTGALQIMEEVVAQEQQMSKHKPKEHWKTIEELILDPEMKIADAVEHFTSSNDLVWYMNAKWDGGLYKHTDSPKQKQQLSSDRALDIRWGTINRLQQQYGALPRIYTPTDEEIWARVDKEERLQTLIDRANLYEIVRCALVELKTPARTLEIWKSLSATEQAEIQMYTPEEEQRHKQKSAAERLANGETLTDIASTFQAPPDYIPASTKKQFAEVEVDAHTDLLVKKVQHEDEQLILPPMERNEYQHDYSRTRGLLSGDEDTQAYLDSLRVFNT